MYGERELVDLNKPMHPVECMACDHFGRKQANISILARQVSSNQWLLVCDFCRKELHWAKKNVIKLRVILQ